MYLLVPYSRKQIKFVPRLSAGRNDATLSTTSIHFDTETYTLSSNIKVQRICKYCGNEFTARTTVTQYCGENCSRRAYKARQRANNIEASKAETIAIISKPIEELKAKEFLSVKEVGKLIGCSRYTVYHLINRETLKAVSIKVKKIVVKRSDIDKLFV